MLPGVGTRVAGVALRGLSEELDDDWVNCSEGDGRDGRGPGSGLPFSLWPILGKSRTINVQYCIENRTSQRSGEKAVVC
jgi:hypothetical protein